MARDQVDQRLEAHAVRPRSALDGHDLAKARAALDAAALVYDVEKHGPMIPVAYFRARDGLIHQVCINLHPEVDWRVIDIAASFVGRLDGVGDLKSSALACALDYARQCQLFHAGLRETHPIPHPESMRIRWRSSADKRRTRRT